jgi:polyhydroxyalkanoate synthase
MSATAKTRAVPAPAPNDPRSRRARRIAAQRSGEERESDRRLRRAPGESGKSLVADELGIGKAFMELAAKMLANPYRLAESQMNLWWNYMNLWQSSTIKLLGGAPEPVATPGKGDKRFKHEDWEQHFLFDYIKQSYLIAADALHDAVGNVEGLDDATKRKVNFFTRQYIDALAPSNFALTNPEVFRETIATGGQNLVKGLHNLLDDIERGRRQLRISMTDPKAFELGVNIATTPGKVVFQNELLQLIQYEATTAKVAKRPLLIIPPWINKYYILDLREKNSFVKWATDQGLTVFVISWVNPDGKLAHKDFEDYLTEGTLAALGAIEKATGEKEVNAVGYCLGGTLLAATLAYMAATRDKRIVSATFMTSLVDFSRAGELEVFIDDEQVASLERKMNERGYLEGSEMANTFNMLRSNDLIWSFVINNYLLGRDPVPLRSPALELRFHADAREDAQLLPTQHVHEEPAARAGAITLANVPIDLSKITVPTYFVSGDRGPHRALEDDVRRPAARVGQVAIRAVGLRSHRGHDQPAVREEIRVLDQRQAARDRRCVARRREAARGVVVGELACLAPSPRRCFGPGARAGQRQAQGDRARARCLRPHSRRRNVTARALSKN